MCEADHHASNKILISGLFDASVHDPGRVTSTPRRVAAIAANGKCQPERQFKSGRVLPREARRPSS